MILSSGIRLPAEGSTGLADNCGLDVGRAEKGVLVWDLVWGVGSDGNVLSESTKIIVISVGVSNLGR